MSLYLHRFTNDDIETICSEISPSLEAPITNLSPSENSIFTVILLNHINQKDKTMNAMTKEIRRKIRKVMNNRQQ